MVLLSCQFYCPRFPCREDDCGDALEDEQDEEEGTVGMKVEVFWSWGEACNEYASGKVSLTRHDDDDIDAGGPTLAV